MAYLKYAFLVVGIIAGAASQSVNQNTYGFTSWSCSDSAPHSWVQVGLSVPLDSATRKHERQHVVDFSQGRCSEQRMRWITDRNYRIWIESRGFCRSARELARQRVMSEDAAFLDAATNLSGAYDFGLSVNAAEMLIRRACIDLDAGR